MDWRWNWLWNIFWNAFIHLISLDWGALSEDGDSFKAWWRSLWDEIGNQVDGAISWARDRTNQIISWAQDWFNYLKGYAYDRYLDAINWAQGQLNSVYSWAQDWFNYLKGYAYDRYLDAINWAQGQLNSLRGWAQGYVDYYIGWLKSLYDWIQPFRSLISGWLVQARNVIDWLWHYAWGHLRAFLSDPIGWVLGWLLNPIINLVNQWAYFGSMIISFVQEDLPNLRNLLARGFSLLMRLVDRPAETILELIASIFVDWLAGVVADEW